MKALSVTISALLFLVFAGCTKSEETPVVLATYELGTGGACSGATVTGRYVADSAVTADNTVTISVNVTGIGPYWITTDEVNGIIFSKIGTFENTGTQNVVLEASGTPLDTGAVNYTLQPKSGPGGNCIFTVSAVEGIPPVYYIEATFNGDIRNFNDSAAATNSDVAGPSGSPGLSVSGKDTLRSNLLRVDFGVTNASAVSPGIYSDTSLAKVYFNYTDSIGGVWSVQTGPEPSFTIFITTMNTRDIEGTFNGIIRSEMGLGTDSIVVTDGKFFLPLQ